MLAPLEGGGFTLLRHALTSLVAPAHAAHSKANADLKARGLLPVDLERSDVSVTFELWCKYSPAPPQAVPLGVSDERHHTELTWVDLA